MPQPRVRGIKSDVDHALQGLVVGALQAENRFPTFSPDALTGIAGNLLHFRIVVTRLKARILVAPVAFAHVLLILPIKPAEPLFIFAHSAPALFVGFGLAGRCHVGCLADDPHGGGDHFGGGADAA